VAPKAIEASPQAPDFAWQGLALGASRIAADAVRSLLVVPGPGTINLAGGYPSEDLQAVDLVARAMARATRRSGAWGRMPTVGMCLAIVRFVSLSSVIAAREGRGSYRTMLPFHRRLG